MTSEIVMDELQHAREQVRNTIDLFDRVKLVEVNGDVLQLAELYIQEGVLTRKSEADALHIAIASVFDANVIISWNFRHMVNSEKLVVTENYSVH